MYMVKKNEKSEKFRTMKKLTEHARVYSFDESMSRHYNKRDKKEIKKAANKDKFARIIFVKDLVESSNENKTYRPLIVFTDEFEIWTVRIFSKNNFLLNERINMGIGKSGYKINKMNLLDVKKLPTLDVFELLQKILIEKYGFKKRPTKKEAQRFLESHRPRRGRIGTMPTGIRHRVLQDHGLQFPNG